MRVVDNKVTTVDHGAKAALFDSLAEVASALGTGHRAEIIDLLAQGERSVDEVATELEQSIANASHHLRALFRAGLVRSRRHGTRIYYRLANSDVEDLWAAIKKVATSVRPELESLAEQYLGSLDDLETIGRDELLERLERGEVQLLDVRPAPEYQAGHIPGAQSVPLAELTERIHELPNNMPVVAYCRGPYCAFAPAAVRVLLAAGLDAARLQDGFPEWRRSGLPVEMEDPPTAKAPSGPPAS